MALKNEEGSPGAAQSAGAWFAVETLPRKEAPAIQNLQMQGLATFWPRFWKTRRHARRQDTVLAPLFPGYVFVWMDPQLFRWRSINGTFGVKCLVMGASGRPEPVPAPVMDFLRARCTGEVMNDLMGDGLAPGQPARVLAGPFAEQLVTIEALPGPGRVRVLLEIMGGTRTLHLDRASLGPA